LLLPLGNLHLSQNAFDIQKTLLYLSLFGLLLANRHYMFTKSKYCFIEIWCKLVLVLYIFPSFMTKQLSNVLIVVKGFNCNDIGKEVFFYLSYSSPIPNSIALVIVRLNCFNGGIPASTKFFCVYAMQRLQHQFRKQF
jgi:hypothetical protein